MSDAKTPPASKKSAKQLSEMTSLPKDLIVPPKTVKRSDKGIWHDLKTVYGWHPSERRNKQALR